MRKNIIAILALFVVHGYAQGAWRWNAGQSSRPPLGPVVAAVARTPSWFSRMAHAIASCARACIPHISPLLLKKVAKVGVGAGACYGLFKVWRWCTRVPDNILIAQAEKLWQDAAGAYEPFFAILNHYDMDSRQNIDSYCRYGINEGLLMDLAQQIKSSFPQEKLASILRRINTDITKLSGYHKQLESRKSGASVESMRTLAAFMQEQLRLLQLLHACLQQHESYFVLCETMAEIEKKYKLDTVPGGSAYPYLDYVECIDVDIARLSSLEEQVRAHKSCCPLLLYRLDQWRSCILDSRRAPVVNNPVYAQQLQARAAAQREEALVRAQQQGTERVLRRVERQPSLWGIIAAIPVVAAFALEALDRQSRRVSVS